MKQFLFFLAIGLSLLVPRSTVAQVFPFFWDQATVYFVMTDRFANGDPANDNAYGRGLDGNGAAYDLDGSGSFNGGDLVGLTDRIEDGYFQDLGVNVLCVTAPYEQVHGRIGGTDREVLRFAYDGYWPLDFTSMDASFGTEEEFVLFVDTAHRNGLRVILDVVLNPAGYAALENEETSGVEGQTYLEFLVEAKWDSTRASDEMASLVAFFERTGYAETPTNHIVKWLADWVRKSGVDGFRVNSADAVDPEDLSRLKTEAVRALNLWKAEHPGKAIDDTDFWMTGDFSGHGPNRSEFFDRGFDSVINFEFQDQAGQVDHLDALYDRYSRAINTDPTFNVLSFVSSNDTRLFDRDRLIDAGTSLFLLPGGIQILYGDETGRPPGPPASDELQATLTFMNWDSIDTDVQAHWSRLGKFRQAHPAVAAGVHEKLGDDPYTFYRGIRLGTEIDHVIVIVGAVEKVRLNVSRIWPDDTILRDAYTGKISMVSFGTVNFQPHANGVLLIEEME